jgi:hypothetical protein
LNTERCARCGREAPSQISDAFLEWEVIDSDGDRVICPGCITGIEQQLMDEDVMAIEEEIRETEKVREIRLRQLAERHGYRLVKSDSTDPGAFDYGTGGSSSQMEPEPVVKTAGHWTSLSELSCAFVNARCGALARTTRWRV